MPNLVTINNTTLEQLTYRDQPVVTFDMIAKVHGVPISNVQQSFRRHQSRFEEGKHVYRLDYIETRQVLREGSIAPNGLRFFTEAGYLLLVKPMRDTRSWEIQECMIHDLFGRKVSQDINNAHHPKNTLLPLAQYRRNEKMMYTVFQNNPHRYIPKVKIRTVSHMGSSRPDFFLDVEGLWSVAEFKYGNFRERHLYQLQEYMHRFNTPHGYAVAQKLACTLPQNVTYICMPLEHIHPNVTCSVTRHSEQLRLISYDCNGV